MTKAFILLLSIYLFSQALALNKNLIIGDKLYSQRKDLAKAVSALEIFEKELKTSPKSIDALWRASMGNYYVGQLAKDEDAKTKHFEAGISQGKQCVLLSGDKKVECYFWLATNTALLKETSGIFSIAFGLGDIIKLFEKALDIDENFAGAGPYRMLSLLHFKAPGFLGGDTKKAYAYIKKAIKLAPNEPLNYFLYIKFLVEDSKELNAQTVARSFIYRADQNKFAFFESISAFKGIKHFLKTNEIRENN